MLVIRNLKLNIKHSEDELIKEIYKKLKITKADFISYNILKKAIDSRNKKDIKYVYNLKVNVKNEKKCLRLKGVEKYQEVVLDKPKVNKSKFKSPIIVGSGPAGLLAGIVLAEAGAKPIIIEQGKDVDKRKFDVEEFWKTGKLLERSNVQFGAGGAGIFSDGKLTTGVNNPLKGKLIEELILAGAPEEIRYESKPHIGTDKLIEVVRNLCKKIEALGGKVYFEHKYLSYKKINNKLSEIIVEDNNSNFINFECDFLILAIGHSARDTFYKLYDQGIVMEAKSFSVGVRIEHLQKDVNVCQYGNYAENLDSASYKLNARYEGRSLYTFCMCPGGVVVGAASEKGRLVTNGMSYYNRDLINSNSALLVNVEPEDFGGDKNPLNGIEFQRELEEKAFVAGGGNYFVPVQKLGDFFEHKVSSDFTKVIPSYKPGFKSYDLNKILPEFVSNTLKYGIKELQNKVDFLKDEEAVLSAIESRSSSPVKILRNDILMTGVYGIIPCGEGAGYAGGIVSAAIDGIRCANVVIEELNKKESFN